MEETRPEPGPNAITPTTAHHGDPDGVVRHVPMTADEERDAMLEFGRRWADTADDRLERLVADLCEGIRARRALGESS